MAAAKEVQAGKSIQLDLRLDHFGHGIAGRQRFKQTIIDFKERNKGTEYEFVAHDDVIAFNTQSSSQWDGFRHVGLQREQVYYNGVTHRHIDEQGDGKLGIHSKSSPVTFHFLLAADDFVPIKSGRRTEASLDEASC